MPRVPVHVRKSARVRMVHERPGALREFLGWFA